MKEFPFVSIVIPMRNEEKFIEDCLDSVLANDYPSTQLEIVVVDGMSPDRSQEIVRAISKRDPRVKLFDNPKIVQSGALNIGIREAVGDIIVRMDAHTIYAPDYVSKCVQTLIESGAANVGGQQTPQGQSYVSEAIAAVVSSPFAAGDAKYRYGTEGAWVDTVFLGCWKKKTLEELGGFREDCGVNEDYELNYRLRKSGGTIFYTPEIKCSYFVRPSLKALWRQYFKYGWSRIRTLRLHPASLRWRQLIPPTFALLLIVSAVLAFWMPKVALIVPAAYVAANLMATAHAVSRAGLKYAPIIPLIFGIIHLGWGFGFLYGILRFGPPRLSPRDLFGAVRRVS